MSATAPSARPIASPRVAVIGAGWAGLAAAVELIDAKVELCLFEAGRVAGGRARSVRHQGQIHDNGQHLLLGAYQETLALMSKVGVDVDAALWRLPFVWRDGSGFVFDGRLGPTWWPLPLRRLWQLVHLCGVPWREKCVLIAFMGRLQQLGWRAPAGNVADWLAAWPMPTLVRHFWSPLVLSAMNTPLAVADAQVFAHILADTLGAADKSAVDFLLPKTALGELFPEPALNYLARRGASLRLGTRVRSLVASETGWFVDGAPFERVIVAVAPPHLPALCAVDVPYRYQPIVTVYLSYAEPIALKHPLQGLYVDAKTRAHWLVLRVERYAAPDYLGHTLAIVTSADGEWTALDNHALIESAKNDLRRWLAVCHDQFGDDTLATLSAPPVATQCIREKRATISADNGCVRLGYHPKPGLWLAGDHTWARYPSTIEGAVRSGRRAAAALLASLSQ